jgi:hypothetical protein
MPNYLARMALMLEQDFSLAYDTFVIDLNHGEMSFRGDACCLTWYLFTLL